MKLAMFQMKNEGSLSANLDKSIRAIREAADHHADLILFPEVQLTEFFPQFPGQDVRSYRVSPESDVMKAFRNAAGQAHILVAPNFFLSSGEKPDTGRAFDASVLIGREGELIGVQKMVHIAQAPQFYEQDYYIPSDDGFHVFDTEIGRIGIVVCFDRHYPESIRTEALRGADLVLIPTANTKAEPSDLFAWEIRVQAFQNSVAIAMCNRVGREGEMDFSGESIVAGANGELLAMADDREQILYTEMDPAQTAKIRRSRPYTSLRRRDLYE